MPVANRPGKQPLKKTHEKKEGGLRQNSAPSVIIYL